MPEIKLVEDACYTSDQVTEASAYRSTNAFYLKLPRSIPEQFLLAVVHDLTGPLKGEVMSRSEDGQLEEVITTFEVERIAQVISLSISKREGLVIVLTAQEDQEGNDKQTVSAVAIRNIEQDQQSNDRLRLNCSGDAFQRLVVSRPAGNAQEVADMLGLTVSQSCDCSDKNLVAVNVPYGIDLETLQPKAKTRVSRALTDSVGLDIDINIIPPKIIEIDPDFDPDQQTSPPFDIYNDSDNCLVFRTSSAPAPTAGKPNFTVAFVDSGYDLVNHESKVVKHKYLQTPPSCIGGAMSVYGFDFTNVAPDPIDTLGHGTDVASAFLSRLETKEAVSILHLKFFDDDRGSYFDALCASYLAIKAEAKIVNWSWGFRADEEPASLTHLLGVLDARGVVAIASAGNDASLLSDSLMYPAAASIDHNNLIAVGSYVYTDISSSPPLPEIATFSNFSNKLVDVAAYASVKTPLANTPFDHSPAGTSISAPLVARKLTEIWTSKPRMNHLDAISELYKSLATNPPALQNEIVKGRYLQNGCNYE
ncbi:MAG: S8 family serine peptidase [Bacteroidota bacterium]